MLRGQHDSTLLFSMVAYFEPSTERVFSLTRISISILYIYTYHIYILYLYTYIIIYCIYIYIIYNSYTVYLQYIYSASPNQRSGLSWSLSTSWKSSSMRDSGTSTSLTHASIVSIYLYIINYFYTFFVYNNN